MTYLQVQAEMNTIITERRVMKSLRFAVPTAIDRTYTIGEWVLIWRENEDLRDGPFTVKTIDEKLLTVFKPETGYDQKFNRFFKLGQF